MSMFQAPLAVVLSSSLLFPSSALAFAPAPEPPGGGEAAGPEGMTDEQKMEKAKALYGEGQAAFDAGDFSGALARWEEAYDVYAPSLHLFNFNIGQAAYELGDCVKAKTAYQRFLDLVPDHPSRGDAQERLIEIERSGCAVAAAEPEPAPIQTGPVTDDDDAPILTGTSAERDAAIERERQQREASKRPLLIAGAVLAGVGGLALIGGGVSLGLANKKANDLADLASPGTTGFPEGNYSDDEVYNLDRNGLPGNNKATVALFIAGGVLATTGIALIAVDITRRKKGGKAATEDKAEASRKRPHLVGAGPTVLPGGGGAAATVRF